MRFEPELTNRIRKYSNEQYIEAMTGYFSPDEETSHEQMKVVKTRKDHQCMGIDHKGESDIIPAGSKAICESAIHVDIGRCRIYVCIDCADKWLEEIYPDI